jgi:hypothetical protein
MFSSYLQQCGAALTAGRQLAMASRSEDSSAPHYSSQESEKQGRSGQCWRGRFFWKVMRFLFSVSSYFVPTDMWVAGGGKAEP